MSSDGETEGGSLPETLKRLREWYEDEITYLA